MNQYINTFSKILTKEFLIQEWTVLGKTAEQISKNVGCNRVTVQYYLKKYNIKTQKRFFDRKTKDLTNQQFGKLKVIGKSDNNLYAKCVCECGTIKDINKSSLKSGRTKSCGCLKKSACFKGYNQITGTYWNKIKKYAKKRNIEFSISIKDAYDIFLNQQQKCALTNIEIYFSQGLINNKMTEQTASLDRIDPLKGYTKDNVQWLHKNINMCKFMFNNQEFINICHLISKNFPIDKNEITLDVASRFIRNPARKEK